MDFVRPTIDLTDKPLDHVYDILKNHTNSNWKTSSSTLTVLLLIPDISTIQFGFIFFPKPDLQASLTWESLDKDKANLSARVIQGLLINLTDIQRLDLGNIITDPSEFE